MNTEQSNDLNEAREAVATTSRPTSEALERILHLPTPVLDHGFVRVVDYMGNDAAVVQAARVSYGRGTRRVSEDRNLIHYLLRNSHTTPFEMCEIKLHVKLPIFVARQWVRHRMANINEYSARYSILDKEFYLPSHENLAMQSSANRQGRGDSLPEEQAESVLRVLRSDAEQAYEHYTWMLNDDGAGNPIDDSRYGVSRELARIGLGLNTYTQWYWKVDLHNLLRFLRLRADPHAQYEIRAYAIAILDIVEQWVPLTFEAFQEYQLNSLSLSRTAASLIKRLLAGEKISGSASGLSRREWDEIAERLGLPMFE